jgi:hypothetical protein
VLASSRAGSLPQKIGDLPWVLRLLEIHCGSEPARESAVLADGDIESSRASDYRSAWLVREKPKVLNPFLL